MKNTISDRHDALAASPILSTRESIIHKLQSLADSDPAYAGFTKRICATSYPILGVRTPALRRLAREIAASPVGECREFSSHPIFYEEIILQGLVLSLRSKKLSLEEAFSELERLVPMFDSWAHVDVIVPAIKVFARHRDEVFRRFEPLKTHPGEFQKRTFVMLMMGYFLDADNVQFALNQLVTTPQGQYYVDMAIAWTLAEALIRHYDIAEPFLRTAAFSRFVHNKAIQKARESFRISPDRKEYLKSLKR